MGAMRRKVSDLPIVVVGAGIGGLTAALCLSRIGRRVAIFEQASQLSEIGAGIQLGPNVFKVFAYLNLTQAVLRNAVLPERYQIVDSLTGENLTHMPLGEACVKRFGFPYGVIHRHDLHEALAEACKAEPRIEIQLNCLSIVTTQPKMAFALRQTTDWYSTGPLLSARMVCIRIYGRPSRGPSPIRSHRASSPRAPC